ncbi:MAG: hydroxymethylglutaryl-CoA lyase, partial [Rhodocyclales bacterium]|nr:hydroxymethylglutaryl-CoA lyase [Rhodocyclales bacterium]
CPYAAGASGNVATEDVVWLMQGLGIACEIDLLRLVETGAWISAQLGREPNSKVARALLAKQACA